MSLSKDDFLKKYDISNEKFEMSGCIYDDLLNIQNDYSKKFQRYDDAGANLVRILLRFDSVHSVKYRIKDPEHLIEKIIRKKEKNPKLDINIGNYQEKIQDLIGIRILHLFKGNWLQIHNAIDDNFKKIEKPEANIRKGDVDSIFKENGCKIKVHPAGYRSVHYLIKTEPTVKTYIAEIQVRTIFEEAWSEIDHKVRYPYFTDNEIVNQYLKIFNRLSGSADEMGDFVMMLKSDVITNQKNSEELKKLKQQIENSSLAKKEKEDFNTRLNKITFNFEKSNDIKKTLDLYSKISIDTKDYLNAVKRMESDLPKRMLKEPPYAKKNSSKEQE